MGKIEKVVVLSVCFLMVVITVVSMTGTKESQPEGGKVASADRSGNRLRSNDRGDLGAVESRGSDRWKANNASATRSRNNPVQAAPDQPPAAEGLLSNPMRKGASTRETTSGKAPVGQTPNVRVQPAAVSHGLVKPTLQPTQPPALDPSWTLKRVDGLQDNMNPAYKSYTCRAGDTFESVALYYYGDKGHALFLRRNNEGVRSLKANLVLQLPCVNDMPLADTYTVVEGDSLWSIAKDQYKAGHRWKEIYDANRHLLRTPDDLRQGLVLTIP